MSTRIAIATHKQAELPTNPLYLPIQVNAELSQSIPGYQLDSEGNNISILNYRYSELTALWWIWKNLSDDNIGMVQYRRMFCKPTMRRGGSINDVITLSEANSLMSRNSIVLPTPRRYYIQTLEEHFLNYSFAESNDIDVFGDVIKKVSPEYREAFQFVMKQRHGHMCNMFIMRKDLLDEYCSWLFAVLNELDKSIDKSRTRILGYFSEHMLDIWIQKNHFEFCELGAVYLDTENEVRKRFGYILRLLGLKNASDALVARQS